MRKKRLLPLILWTVFLFSTCIAGSNNAYAHCDTMSGPVVKDAREAFEKKDITPVLKWVSQEKEPEVRAAFDAALTERSQGPTAQEKADMKFFETLIRIHRAGEGASFSGIKPAEAVEPIEVEADKALESGSAESLTGEMAGHLTGEIKKKFSLALEKKKHMNESVAAGREYVEAYVAYLHYVEGVHKAITAKAEHHSEEGGGQAEHDEK